MRKKRRDAEAQRSPRKSESAKSPARKLAVKRKARKREAVARTKVARPVEKKLGRPTKYTPEVVEIIKAAVKSGLSPTRAGMLAGLNAQTVSEWRGRFPEFSDAIELARCEGLKERLENIERSGIMDWRATAWLVEKTFPEEYGKQAAINISATANASASAVAVMSDEELAKLQERRAAALVQAGADKAKQLGGEKTAEAQRTQRGKA